MDRKWIVAAFLDITGFRSWTYRASTAPEVKEKFIESFYRILQDYVRTQKEVWSKYEGDGIITIREFTPKERKAGNPIRRFVLDLKTLYREVQKVIKESESAPDDVRIRIMDGYVFKLMVLDPNDPERKKLIPEYLDYCTNTVRGLLGVNPEIPCLATKGLVQAMGKSRSVFRVRSLGAPSYYPKGVNNEDVEGLQILRF